MTKKENTNSVETKIVKAPSKKTDEERDTEPKIKVKAAKVNTAAAAKSKTVKAAPVARGAAAERTGRKNLPGKPMPKNSGRPPIEKAKAKKEVVAEIAKEAEEKAAAAVEAGKNPSAAVEDGKNAPVAEQKEDKKPESKKPAADEKKAAESADAAEAEAKQPETKSAEAGKSEVKPAETKSSESKKAAEGSRPAARTEKKKAAPEAGKHTVRRPVRRQEIKIIKTAEQQREEKSLREKKAAEARKAAALKKNEKESRSGSRNEGGGRPAGRHTGERKSFEGRGGEKSSDRNSGGRRSSFQSSDEKKPETSKSSRSVKKRNEKEKDKERDKFTRLEKRHSRQDVKSLEKKTRKKHIKQKPEPEPEVEAVELPAGTKVINVPITIAGFCEQTGVSIPSVIMTLLKLGVVANQNQNIDDATVEMIAEEMGIKVVIGSVEEEEQEEGLDLEEDRESDLKPRPPIITVMGHVDHGKTSLLDAIRKTNVTASESGGITQHIGASEVEINGQKIVFLDTPGHEAFTAMRARGADITDIAVLVVAADDSVKPQTVESISHAKAADVPIIVAINKMDKPGADPDRVKKDLTEHGIVVEEWGGDVICVPVSAKTGEGIVNLLEMILLQAEVLELKANPDRLAMGTVLEARLDKAKGPVASMLVTNGTLKAGQSIVAGTCAGRIRLMTDHKGNAIRKAGPATAVEVLGLTDVPAAGDTFNAVSEDRTAKEIAEKRKLKQREELMAKTSGSTLEELFSQIKEGETKELPLIIKADVRGSVGAVISSLEKLSDENVKVNIIHSGVGAITESDVTLAGTSGAVVIGFNVRPGAAVSGMAEHEGVQIRTYRVIYDIIDDVENAMKGMLDPEYKEEVLGECEVRDTFKVPGVGIIAGGYVTNGKIVRNAEIRLVRDGIVIHEGVISSLKRFKDDAREVAQGYECGIGIDNYNDIKEGDVIECYHMVELERK